MGHFATGESSKESLKGSNGIGSTMERFGRPDFIGSDRDVMCVASCGSSSRTSSDTSSKADPAKQERR
jgi:hypothetical protein